MTKFGLCMANYPHTNYICLSKSIKFEIFIYGCPLLSSSHGNRQNRNKFWWIRHSGWHVLITGQGFPYGWTSIEVDWRLKPKENNTLMMHYGTSVDCPNELNDDSACRQQFCSVLFLGNGLLLADGMWMGRNTKSGKNSRPDFQLDFMILPISTHF